MKQVDSLATSLRCIECGGASPLGYTLQCPTCGGLLELLYDEPLLRKLGTGAFTGTGLWRYAPVLPIADPAHRVFLGEGATPLLDCPRLARELGVQRLVVKFEGANPTGTVKDRSSATGVSAALQFGFAVTSVVSSGNAGSSIAAYSARAGLRSLIFCYERASAPKMLHMAATATDLVIYKGVYDDLITLWDRLAEEGLFFDCGASRNPYKHEGKKTIAYEIAEGLGWRAPDLVVAPVAVGETFIAASRGFAEMERLGLIARRPIMAAAQAARANAVVRAWRDKAAITPLTVAGFCAARALSRRNDDPEAASRPFDAGRTPRGPAALRAARPAAHSGAEARGGSQGADDPKDDADRQGNRSAQEGFNPGAHQSTFRTSRWESLRLSLQSR